MGASLAVHKGEPLLEGSTGMTRVGNDETGEGKGPLSAQRNDKHAQHSADATDRSADETPPTMTAAKRWAIVLVHGVGDAQPSDMLEAVTRVMSSVNPNLALDAYNQDRQLPERDPISKTRAHFPVFTRRGRSGGDTVVFAEVYWADLTRVGVDTHNFVLSLIGFIYGIRHIALQASQIPTKLGSALDAVLRLTVSILLGPIFALFIFELIIYSIYLLYFDSELDRTAHRQLGYHGAGGGNPWGHQPVRMEAAG